MKKVFKDLLEDYKDFKDKVMLKINYLTGVDTKIKNRLKRLEEMLENEEVKSMSQYKRCKVQIESDIEKEVKDDEYKPGDGT